jgi:hypothetical protein
MLKQGLEFLITLLQGLNLLSLALTRELSSPSVAQDTLDSSLLLLILGLGPFPDGEVSCCDCRLCVPRHAVGASAYLGGRLVLGSGKTCPHDFRFFVVFFSPDSSGAGLDLSARASSSVD